MALGGWAMPTMALGGWAIAFARRGKRHHIVQRHIHLQPKPSPRRAISTAHAELQPPPRRPHVLGPPTGSLTLPRLQSLLLLLHVHCLQRAPARRTARRTARPPSRRGCFRARHSPAQPAAAHPSPSMRILAHLARVACHELFQSRRDRDIPRAVAPIKPVAQQRTQRRGEQLPRPGCRSLVRQRRTVPPAGIGRVGPHRPKVVVASRHVDALAAQVP
eukprot:scaffold19556_cov98-Isochrysis_galbana.AAC.3